MSVSEPKAKRSVGSGVISRRALLLGAAGASVASMANWGAIRARTLIPRADLFGHPKFRAVDISPDGTMLSWLAPSTFFGVSAIWVAPRERLEAARQVTARTSSIDSYWWSDGSAFLYFYSDREGDEDQHLFAVEVATGTTRDLTPFDKIHALALGDTKDDDIGVAINNRDPKWHDIWRINARTGERSLIFANTEQFGSIVLDGALRPRLGSRDLPANKGTELIRLDDGARTPFLEIEAEDAATFNVLGFNRRGDTLFALSAIGRDRMALVAYDWASRTEQLLGAHPKADVVNANVNWQTGDPDLITATHLRTEWIGLTDRARKLLELVDRLPTGEITRSVGRSDDDRYWVAERTGPTEPGHYYLIDTISGAATRLFEANPKLKTYRLARVHPEVIRARDGLELVSYLTLPIAASERVRGRPARPQPMVLLVHGGPAVRDSYEFDTKVQWLADRGYAVLQVNFRGSTGFGKAFVNAGDGQWGRQMHDDLIDAVEWAIAQRIASRDRIAIMGASYGGYAVLVGLTFTPEVFRCGVCINGVSNLETDLGAIPAYWSGAFEQLARQKGDPRTEEGRKRLRDASPIHRVAAIRRPLLISNGANDPRVNKAQTQQMVDAMKARSMPVIHALYPHGGHTFFDDNAYPAVAEMFLAHHLGGAVEPFGTDIETSSLQVTEGAEQLPGLKDELARLCTKSIATALCPGAK
ncbi:MAG TPA: S9 family peptidase [Hyphomicrobiaceae bacterium]|nr:S9 family peptidase [Hyphomicrobiaceae bacterium]